MTNRMFPLYVIKNFDKKTIKGDALSEEKTILKGCWLLGERLVELDKKGNMNLYFKSAIEPKYMFQLYGEKLSLFMQYQNEMFYFLNISIENLKKLSEGSRKGYYCISVNLETNGIMGMMKPA